MTTTNIPATAHRVVHKILADGGATESIVIGVSTPDSGYVVSFREHERKVKVSTDGTLAQHRARLVDQLAGYAFQKAFVLTKPGHYLGAWIDGDTLYLDVSEIVADLPTAVKRAVERDQLAIFSLTTHMEIQIGPGRVGMSHPEQVAAWEIQRELDPRQATPVFEVVAEGVHDGETFTPAGIPSDEQRALLIVLHTLSDTIERVVPSSTAHYGIEGLRETLAYMLDPKHQAYAGRVVTNDVKAARG